MKGNCGIPTFENKFFVTHPGTSDIPKCNTIIRCADYRQFVRLKWTEGLVLTEACLLLWQTCAWSSLLKRGNLKCTFWYAVQVLWIVVRIMYVKLE